MRRPIAALTQAVVFALVLLSAGCAVGPESKPVEIEPANLSIGSSNVNAEGSGRVYFVGPGEGELLRAVPRDVKDRRDLIEVLLAGPNSDELEQNYFTAIPPDTRLNKITPIGPVLQLDFTDELTQLSGDALSNALAQIVYTVTDINGIDKVRIYINGEAKPWPTDVGTASSDGLSVYDFPDAIRTSQPAYPAQPLAPAS